MDSRFTHPLVTGCLGLLLFVVPLGPGGCGTAASTSEATASSITAHSISSSGTSTAYFSVVSANGQNDFVASTRTPTVTVTLAGGLSRLTYSVNTGAEQSLPTTQGTAAFQLDLSSSSGSAVVTMRGVDAQGLFSELKFTVHDGTRPLLAYFPDAAAGDAYVYEYQMRDSTGGVGTGTLSVTIVSVDDNWVNVETSGSSDGNAIFTHSARYPRRQSLNLALMLQGSGYCLLSPLTVDPSTLLGTVRSFASDVYDCATSTTLGRFTGTVTMSQAASGTVGAGTFTDVVAATFSLKLTSSTDSSSSSLRAIGAVGLGMVYSELSLPSGTAVLLGLSGARLGDRTVGTVSKADGPPGPGRFQSTPRPTSNIGPFIH